MIDVSVAEFVINRFGGLTACARKLGKGVSTVQRWQDSGTIPLKHWPLIESAAFKEGWLDLSARWLGEAHAAQEVRDARARAAADGDDKISKCGAV
jgi:hypothetical protein